MEDDHREERTRSDLPIYASNQDGREGACHRIAKPPEPLGSDIVRSERRQGLVSIRLAGPKNVVDGDQCES